MRDLHTKLKSISGRHWILLSGVTLALLMLLLTGSHTLFAIARYHEQLSPQMFVLWLAGLMGGIVLPPLAAAMVWRMVRGQRLGCLVDLMLLPALWGITWATDSMVLYAVDEPDMDGPSGWVTMPATFLMMIVLATYLACLSALVVRTSAQREGS
jgi:hypothetical protein